MTFCWPSKWPLTLLGMYSYYNMVISNTSFVLVPNMEKFVCLDDFIYFFEIVSVFPEKRSKTSCFYDISISKCSIDFKIPPSYAEGPLTLYMWFLYIFVKVDHFTSHVSKAAILIFDRLCPKTMKFMSHVWYNVGQF